MKWHPEIEQPSEPGWYAIKRGDGSLCLRAFGKDMQWWIPLKDGWVSGLPSGFKWIGPLQPIDWDTPNTNADRYEFLRDRYTDTWKPFQQQWQMTADQCDKVIDMANRESKLSMSMFASKKDLENAILTAPPTPRDHTPLSEVSPPTHRPPGD
jgi:hypothetical protein